MPEVPGKVAILIQPVYDTIQIPAAAGFEGHFFAVPFGGILAGAVTKTWAHTNLVQAGRLEKGVEFDIMSLALFVREVATGGAAPTDADKRNINLGVLTLSIGQQEFLKLPIAAIPNAGAEPVMTAAATTVAATTLEQLNRGGVSHHTNRFYVNEQPIHLGAQESIDVEISDMGTLGAVTDVTLMLFGNYMRPVR